MRSTGRILSVSCGYAAAIVGAGFASGQEILSFFGRYGRYGIIGIIIACAVFALFSHALLSVCIRLRIQSCDEYISSCFGKKTGRCVRLLTLVFSMSSLCVMTACAGEMGTVLFGIKRIIGAVFFVTLCGVILFSGNRKIMKINSALGAVIVFSMVLCCLYILRFREHSVFFYGTAAIPSGISYAGYNLIGAGAILAGMSRYLKDEKEAAAASVSAGTMLFVMMTLVWGLLEIYYGKISLGEIPMITLAVRESKMLGGIYGIILFLAVLTTGISNGFTLTDIAASARNKKITVSAVLFTALCMSGAGFSKLINTAYRFCGYIGAILVCAVILKYFKKYELGSKTAKTDENKSKTGQKLI